MRQLTAIVCVMVAATTTSCVERSFLVQTDPPGARVWINGQDRGTTPVTIPYVHPGRFDVRIEKQGYESIADEFTTGTTIDAVPGPDFFAENVWPGKIERKTTASYRLEPLKQTSYTRDELMALWKAGEAFRVKARAAAVEAGTPKSTKPASGR